MLSANQLLTKLFPQMVHKQKLVKAQIVIYASEHRREAKAGTTPKTTGNDYSKLSN